MSALFFVLSGVWTRLTGVLSFLARPPGLYALAVLLVLAAIWWSGERGYRRGGEACEARHALAALREGARQDAAGVSAVTASETRTTESAAQDRTNREIVADAKARAESLPPPPANCPAAVPADLADRLRQLR